MGSHRSAVVASGVLLAVLTVAACSPGESGPTVGVTTAVSTTRTLPTPAPPIAPLPADGPASVGGVALPAGVRIFALDGQGNPGPPRAWLTDIPTDQVRSTWEALARQFPTTGLWPLATDGLDGDTGRPWRSSELGPVVQPGADVDAWFRAHDTAPNERHGPPFEGLARGTPGPPAQENTEYRDGPRPRRSDTTGLLLVPVQRPADALSALGWLGATNYDMTGADLSAVLRSWEDRFGATLMAVGYDTIDLHVTRPPIDAHDHRALAKEHTLFDPDLLSNLMFSEYAEAIETTDVWSFWWD